MTRKPVCICVASTNPVKVRATWLGFERMFPEWTFDVQEANTESGVGDQPMSDEETRRGAATRASAGRTALPDADFSVGIEGGIESIDGDYHAFAWIVVLGRETVGSSRTGTFGLPPKVAALIDDGMELGHANDTVFNEHNSKQHAGAVGLLTDGLIDRTELYVHALQLALIPFKQRSLYPVR